MHCVGNAELFGQLCSPASHSQGHFIPPASSVTTILLQLNADLSPGAEASLKPPQGRLRGTDLVPPGSHSCPAWKWEVNALWGNFDQESQVSGINASPWDFEVDSLDSTEGPGRFEPRLSLTPLAFVSPLFPFSKTLTCSLESLLIGNYLHASSIFLGEPQPREHVKRFEVQLYKLQHPWLHYLSKDQCIQITQVLMCFSSSHFSALHNPHALPTSYSQAFVFITLQCTFFGKFTNIYIFQKSILFPFVLL